MRVLPVTIDNPKGNVLIGGSSSEHEQHGIVVGTLLNNLIGRRLRFVNEIGVEDIELISLYHFWWRIIRAVKPFGKQFPIYSLVFNLLVVCLIVLVPFVPCMYSV